MMTGNRKERPERLEPCSWQWHPTLVLQVVLSPHRDAIPRFLSSGMAVRLRTVPLEASKVRALRTALIPVPVASLPSAHRLPRGFYHTIRLAYQDQGLISSIPYLSVTSIPLEWEPDGEPPRPPARHPLALSLHSNGPQKEQV